MANKGPTSEATHLPWPVGFARHDVAGLPWLDLPAQWQRVDVIADLHLSAHTPHIAAALRKHLLSTPADAVWLLGDVFEVWVGDDVVQPEPSESPDPEAARLFALLGEAANRPGLSLGLMRGNRDFLLGDALLQRFGVTPWPDPMRVRAWGQSAVFTHGDALCLDDAAYLAFRETVRQAPWQQAFCAQPLAQRLAYADTARQRSRQSQQQAHRAASAAGEGPPGDIHPLAPAALLAAADCERLIHGHTHRPQDHVLPDGRQRHVIADWREDASGLTQAEVLVWTPQGVHRQSLV